MSEPLARVPALLEFLLGCSAAARRATGASERGADERGADERDDFADFVLGVMAAAARAGALIDSSAVEPEPAPPRKPGAVGGWLR